MLHSWANISMLLNGLHALFAEKAGLHRRLLLRYFFNSVRDSANPFKIDTSKIFLCGASAGAFNVLHAVYLDSLDILDAQWKNSLEGVGGVFGRYDFIDFGCGSYFGNYVKHRYIRLRWFPKI